MSLDMLSKILPYALMAFVGVAGWSMRSTALLSIVVLGTMGIAIGTAMTNRPQPEPDVETLNTVEHVLHEQQRVNS